MSVSVSLNGLSYTLPSTDETGWGTNVTGFLQAVSTGTLQKAGGTFTLTADANFGGTYGLVSSYFTSRTTSAATAGAFRLARADYVSWRNQAGAANLLLGVDSSNNLEWEGVDVVTATGTQTLTNKTLTAPVITAPTITGATTIGTGATITTPTITDPAWTAFTYVNSWVDFAGAYATAGYRKLANGDVQLRGAVKSGTSGTATITTLPAGFRPTGTFQVVTSSNGRIVSLRITSAGVVAGFDSTTETVQTAELVLDGIRFPTT